MIRPTNTTQPTTANTTNSHKSKLTQTTPPPVLCPIPHPLTHPLTKDDYHTTPTRPTHAEGDEVIHRNVAPLGVRLRFLHETYPVLYKLSRIEPQGSRAPDDPRRRLRRLRGVDPAVWSEGGRPRRGRRGDEFALLEVVDVGVVQVDVPVRQLRGFFGTWVGGEAAVVGGGGDGTGVRQ